MTGYERTVAFWQQKKIRTDAEALNGHSIAFAYHSGRIENENITYNDTREIFEHDGVIAYTGDLRTLFEIRNARDANELLLASFGARRPLDETLVKEFQECLTRNTYDTRRWQLGERPGEYKHHDYVTGCLEIGAPPEDVEEEMAELLAEMTDIPQGKELIAAAYFHAKLENIHPFADACVIIGTRLKKPSKINGFALLSPIFLSHAGWREDGAVHIDTYYTEGQMGLCA